MLAGNMRGGRVTTSSTCQIPIPACIRTSSGHRRYAGGNRRCRRYFISFPAACRGAETGPRLGGRGDKKECRDKERRRHRCRSMTASIIPAASTWDSCLLSSRHAGPHIVMPGLVPGIHAAVRRKRWREMPGTSPGMTEEPVDTGRSERRAPKPSWVPIDGRRYKSAIRRRTPARAFRARRTRSPGRPPCDLSDAFIGEEARFI